ncbi:MAG TPA: hypothetical protein VF186_00670 [Gaiellaceae bacterium]|jgi:hypothetical protein
MAERDDERQPEVDERHDSLVVEGDDVDHVLPPQPLDLYTPEPGRRPGDRRAFNLMWVAIAILIAIVVLAIVFTR